MNINNVESLVKKGLEFKNNGKFKKSIDLLEKVVLDYPDYENKNGLFAILAGNYYELKLYDEVINYSYKVISNNPKVELTHLLLYLSYYETDEDEKAFMVLFAFLEKYLAELFKDTLEELLEGLSEGYGANHKDDIILYSRKNGISIPKNLSTDCNDTE